MKLVRVMVVVSLLFSFQIFSADSFNMSVVTNDGMWIHSSGYAAPQKTGFEKFIQAVPPIAVIVGIVNYFRGKSGKSTRMTHAGHSCRCGDPDLCWVNKRPEHKIARLYDDFLAAIKKAELFATSSESAAKIIWQAFGHSNLSGAAKKRLWERFKQEKARREQKEQELMQQREAERKRRQEKEERIKQEKITQQKPVRDFFLERATEVQVYEQHLAQDLKKSEDLYPKDRLQRRRDAVQKAIQEQFKISYQRYEISSQASNLLKQHNIDATVFGECVGNAIQQEAHVEFIEVLNSGADLSSSQETQHLVDNYFATLGNFSFVGVVVNNVGHYDVAHKISDVCHDFYDFVKAAKIFLSEAGKPGNGLAEFLYCDACQSCSDVVDVFKSAFNTIADGMHKAAVKANDGIDTIIENRQAIGEFASGVLDKAFRRPLRSLGKALQNCMAFVGKYGALEASIRHDFGSPETKQKLEKFQKEYCEPLNNTVSGIARLTGDLFIAAGKMGALESSVKYDLRSKETKRIYEEFMHDCIDPLNKKINVLVEEFHRMPNSEKAQEVIAFLLQIGVTRGLQATTRLLATEKIGINLGVLGKEISVLDGGQVLANAPLGISVPSSVAIPVAVASDIGAKGALATPGILFAMSSGPEFGGSGQKERVKPKKTVKDLPFKPMKIPTPYEEIQQIFGDAFRELGFDLPTADDVFHIFDRHCPGGPTYQFNSLNGRKLGSVFNFNDNKTFMGLMLEVLKHAEKNPGKAFIYDCGYIIGKGKCGTPTSLVKVVFKNSGKTIRTMFPFVQ